MALKACGLEVFSLVSELPMRQYQANRLIHFGLANMVGWTARTLQLCGGERRLSPARRTSSRELIGI
jgi:hypothetical protein